MTYENGTEESIGKRAEQWTRDLLSRLAVDKIQSRSASALGSGESEIDGHGHTNGERRLTGHFSFDFIVSTRNGELYPIECNARVHTAIILLPLSDIAGCYTLPEHTTSTTPVHTLRPLRHTRPRSWIYNDLIMRYLPRLIPSAGILGLLHPSLPATILPLSHYQNSVRPNEGLWTLRLDPSLVADDPVPFLILWHVYWPSLLMIRWWQGKSWTRVSGSSAMKLKLGSVENIADSIAECEHGSDLRSVRRGHATTESVRLEDVHRDIEGKT